MSTLRGTTRHVHRPDNRIRSEAILSGVLGSPKPCLHRLHRCWALAYQSGITRTPAFSDLNLEIECCDARLADHRIGIARAGVGLAITSGITQKTACLDLDLEV